MFSSASLNQIDLPKGGSTLFSSLFMIKSLFLSAVLGQVNKKIIPMINVFNGVMVRALCRILASSRSANEQEQIIMHRLCEYVHREVSIINTIFM